MSAPKRFVQFMEDHPEIASAYSQMGEAVSKAGPLDAKQIALAKIGISAGAKMQGAMRSHIRKALDAGVTKEEIKHVLLLTITTNGFPNMMATLSWAEDLLEESNGE